MMAKHIKYLLLTFCINSSTEVLAVDIIPPEGIRNYSIRKAPKIHLPNIDQEFFDSDSIKGQWVFYHFWASWCGPCRKEMPNIQRLSKILKDDPVKIILINTAEDEDTIFEFMASTNMEMDTLMDRSGEITEQWQPRGLPATYLVDPDGNIQYQAIGGRQWDDKKYVDFLRQLILSTQKTSAISTVVPEKELNHWGYQSTKGYHYSKYLCAKDIGKKAIATYQGIKEIKPTASPNTYYRFTIIREIYNKLNDAKKRMAEIKNPPRTNTRVEKSCYLRKAFRKNNNVYIVATDSTWFKESEIPNIISNLQKYISVN